jgi:hypothetical protein
MLLKANENISRRYYGFAYFRFEDQEAAPKINNLIGEYRTLRGPHLRELKSSCNDIARIYDSKIKSKFGALFTIHHQTLGRIFGKPTTLKDAQQLFETLGDADRVMVDYIERTYLNELDKFVNDIDDAMDNKDLLSAERRRLGFKAESRERVKQLEDLNDDLSDLVNKFADLAGTPVTLPSENECLKDLPQQT